MTSTLRHYRGRPWEQPRPSSALVLTTLACRPHGSEGRRSPAPGPKVASCGPPGSSFAHLFDCGHASYTPRPVAARCSSSTLAQPADEPLAVFSPAVREWFQASFAQPTAAQVGGWAAIAAGRHTLIHAPTGSGKTLAAFLWC